MVVLYAQLCFYTGCECGQSDCSIGSAFRCLLSSVLKKVHLFRKSKQTAGYFFFRPNWQTVERVLGWKDHRPEPRRGSSVPSHMYTYVPTRRRSGFKCGFWHFFVIFKFSTGLRVEICPSSSGTLCVFWAEKAHQAVSVAVKAFISVLWPGHKDSCGRQQWVWYRTTKTPWTKSILRPESRKQSCRNHLGTFFFLN